MTSAHAAGRGHSEHPRHRLRWMRKSEHIYQVFAETNASAALAASIFHYGTYTVGDVKKYLADRGVLVR